MSEVRPAEVRAGNSGRGDYPRMLYHADGRTCIVETPEEHEPLHAQGWDTQPPAAPPRPVSNYGTLGAVSDPLVETLRQVIRDEVRTLLREEFNLRNIGRRYSNYGASDG